MTGNKLITIVGMGDNLGLALARLFGKNGFTVAMVSRSSEKLEYFQKLLDDEGVEAYYYTADVINEAEFRSVFGYIQGSLGNPDVLIYNAASVRRSDLLREIPSQLLHDFQVNVIGAIVAVQQVLPAMKARKEGKIFFTGGGLSIFPNWQYGSLGIGKAGLRNAAYSLHQELKAKNIHVATVTICGAINHQDEKYNPTAVAEQFWALYLQKQEAFEKEITY